jgi:SAM-dependent methyltransferase
MRSSSVEHTVAARGKIPGIDLACAIEPGTASPSPWDAYWERLTCHVTSCAEAVLYVERLARVLPLSPDARVLDFGGGFGVAAALVAPFVQAIVLWDAAPAMRRHAAARLATTPNARVVDGFPGDATFDLVLVNSVIQYMSVHDRRAWLPRWRAVLAPTGAVVVSDVPSGERGARLRDLTGILAFHARRRRLATLLRERVGDVVAYHRAARARPLTTLTPDALRDEAAAAGFAAQMLDASLTCRRRRLAAVLRPA